MYIHILSFYSIEQFKYFVFQWQLLVNASYNNEMHMQVQGARNIAKNI